MKTWLGISPRPEKFENTSVSSSVSGCVPSALGFPSAEGDALSAALVNVLVLSSLTMLFLRWISASHPLCEKLPRRISPCVGAFPRASPAACQAPRGRPDSKNLTDALRKRPEVPDEVRDIAGRASVVLELGEGKGELDGFE